MLERRKKPKEKRRSSEKRKEKSRDAARCRRSRETDIFMDLAGALPMPQDQASHLDKASVMRLAIAYLKVRSVVDALEPSPLLIEKELKTKMDGYLPKALDGFVLIISENGDMVYLSENVSEYLGVSQMEMMGQSVYDYSHPCDHDEIRDWLLMKPQDIDEKRPCNFLLRFKCTLTSKGRKVNLKSASYKVIHCIGRPMLTQITSTAYSTENLIDMEGKSLSSDSAQEDSQDDSQQHAQRQLNNASLVIIGCPIPHPSNIEIPLGRHTFLSKHNLNMKFTYVDERLTEYLGWGSKDLIGHSVFEFHHAFDYYPLDKAFKSLFNKGQCETMAYRFLGQTGGYAWIVTQATLIYCPKQRKPVSVVCVNYILSQLQCENEVYTVRQLEARRAIAELSPNESIATTTETLENDDVPTIDEKSHEERQKVELQKTYEIETDVLPQRTRPLSVTASLIKDRTSDTGKEWLFQNKPVLDYEQISQRVRSGGVGGGIVGNSSGRPQSVTRNIFSSTGLFALSGQENQLSQPTCGRLAPQTATASIFAPRTEEMSKGFLTFSEDQPGLTMLKDEPEDLTHLAPTPGDVCVPLEESPFLSDMLDEFILSNENYCSLLSPSLSTELHNSDLSDETIKEPSGLGRCLESDPFFYRETTTSPICSDIQSKSDLNSSTVQHSPDSQSTDSLRSTDATSCPTLGSSISEDDMLMLSITDVIADEELALRAPYIPMSDQDEALQLLISDDMVMWGPTQPPDKRMKWNTDQTSEKSLKDSSLAKLLTCDSDTDKGNNYMGRLVDPIQVLGQTSRKGMSERPSKRLHGSTSLNNVGESKRMRCNEPQQINAINKSVIVAERLEINRAIVTADVNIVNNNRLNDELEADTNCGQTLLLQQLMTDRDMPAKIKNAIAMNQKSIGTKNRDKADSGGGGGGGQRNEQSNSVLKNLLVSGCDKACDELPMMIEKKLRMPLHVNEISNHHHNELSTNYSMSDEIIDPISNSPKKFLINSNINSPIGSSLSDQFNSNSMYSFTDDIDNYDGNPLSPGSELLQSLEYVA